MDLVQQENNMFKIHFIIHKNGRISLNPLPGDTVLHFHKRKETMIRSMGEALIKIADEAKKRKKKHICE